MQVVILERNKLVGRKLARLFLATGASAVTLDEPAALGEAIDGADVVCADAFDYLEGARCAWNMERTCSRCARPQTSWSQVVRRIAGKRVGSQQA